MRLLDASMAHDFKGCDFGGPRCFPKGHPGTTAGVFGTFWPAAGGGPYTLHRARHTAHMRAVCQGYKRGFSVFELYPLFTYLWVFCVLRALLVLVLVHSSGEALELSRVTCRESAVDRSLRTQETGVESASASASEVSIWGSWLLCSHLLPTLSSSPLLASSRFSGTPSYLELGWILSPSGLWFRVWVFSHFLVLCLCVFVVFLERVLWVSLPGGVPTPIFRSSMTTFLRTTN